MNIVKQETDTATKNSTDNTIKSDTKATGAIQDAGQAVSGILDSVSKFLPWNSPIGALVCGIIVIVLILMFIPRGGNSSSYSDDDD